MKFFMTQNIRTLLLLLIASFLVISCKESLNENDFFDDNEIQEVVLRDLFVNNGAGYYNTGGEVNTTIKFYFVGFYSQFDSNCMGIGPKIDPTDDFIARFKNYYKPVKKVSECNTLYFPAYGVTYKNTNEPGWEFAAGNASCYTYSLFKENNRWYISYKSLRWTS